LPQRLLQALSGKEPATSPLSNRLFHKVLGDRIERAVRNGSERLRHPDRSLPFALIFTKVGIVQHHVAWDLNAPFPPR
jgi:hypothetical protein